MGKNSRAKQVAAPKLLTGEAAQERALKAADAAWDMAYDRAQKAYDQGMIGAWSRYAEALKAHGKGPSGKADFSKRYDKDREAILKVWQEAANSLA